MKRKNVLIAVTAVLLLTSCGEPSGAENDFEKVLDAFNEGSYRYTMELRTEDPYEDPDVISIGIEYNSFEGEITNSPYAEHRFVPEGKRNDMNVPEWYWFTQDGKIKTAFGMNLEDGLRWLTVADTNVKGIEEYLGCNLNELDFSMEREEEDCTVFTAWFEKESLFNTYMGNGDPADADDTRMYSYECKISCFVDKELRNLKKIVIDFEGYGKIVEMLRLMEEKDLSEAEARAEAEKAEETYQMVVTFTISDFNEDIEIEVPAELLDGSWETQ